MNGHQLLAGGFQSPAEVHFEPDAASALVKNLIPGSGCRYPYWFFFRTFNKLYTA